MEILLSPHDRWLKGLCSSSWTCIDRNSQFATLLGVRQKSISIHCSCGDLINSYLSLTPVPGLVLKGTGANYSEKNVQLIIEHFNLLALISDRSSPLSTAANFLSYKSNLNCIMAERGNPIV